jgi:hypothetical protein
LDGAVVGTITSPRPNATVSAARTGLIPNGDFANGLDGWFISDPRSARLERSERDEGEKLHVLAQPAANLDFVNSSRFPVTAGAEYKLVIGAGVAPGSRGAGIFSLVFLSTRELSRNLTRADPPAGPLPYSEYTLMGTVPQGASQAMFQVSHDQREGIVDLSLYDISYAEMGTIDVTGWAIDSRAAPGSPSGTTTGIESVSLYLDGPAGTGELLGEASQGVNRGDLARACGNARLANAGWRYPWDVRSVSFGEHTLFVVAKASDGTTSTTSTKVVVAPTFRDDPIGGVDVPLNGTALPQVALISGWAIDRNSSSGSGVDDVSVYLDGGSESGIPLGKAVYGDARRGVALHFGDARFGKSGWDFHWDTSSVVPGSHTLSVVFHSTVTGNSTTISRQVTVGGGREISRGRPARSSRFWQDSTPAMAVDGLVETVWNAGAFAPQWIEVDLETTAAVAGLRLVTAQAPWTGFTSHRVYGRGADGSTRLLHEFSGITTEGQVLEYSPPLPWTGIRFIRVETVESGSWVAWREIGAYLERSTPTASVSGVVRSTNEPLPGALVELRNSDAVVQTGFTDESGAYLFVGIPAGTYTVRAFGPSNRYARRAESASRILDAGGAVRLEPLSLPER